MLDAPNADGNGLLSLVIPSKMKINPQTTKDTKSTLTKLLHMAVLSVSRKLRLRRVVLCAKDDQLSVVT